MSCSSAGRCQEHELRRRSVADAKEPDGAAESFDKTFGLAGQAAKLRGHMIETRTGKSFRDAILERGNRFFDALDFQFAIDCHRGSGIIPP